MATDVHLIKKILLKPANKTINVADIVKRNELERKEEKNTFALQQSDRRRQPEIVMFLNQISKAQMIQNLGIWSFLEKTLGNKFLFL